MKINHILVYIDDFLSDDPYAVIQSNIDVLNILGEAGIMPEDVLEDSYDSFNVDYYHSEYRNGNFTQFLYNSGFDATLHASVVRGLKKIGASEHLVLFEEQLDKVNALGAHKLDTFLNSSYFGENAVRDLLKNDRFFEIQEDLIALNSKWLKSHPQLRALDAESLEECLQAILKEAGK